MFVFWASIIPRVLLSDCVFGVAIIPCILLSDCVFWVYYSSMYFAM